MTPPKRASLLSAPRLSRALPSATNASGTSRLLSEPIWLFDTRASRAPDPTCTALAGNARALSSARVPALTVVVPVRLCAPLRVSVPVPSLFKPPLPLITPA